MGRVILRNTRAAIPNFPKRQAHFYPLVSDDFVDLWQKEFKADCDESLADYNYKDDPRLLWLVDFLKNEKSKILLICHTIDKVFAIEAALQKHIAVKTALFHEQMTLLQRDRNAAWFSEQDGAQLLICSEIGSEGRNFQFSNHLVLYDVPLNPELLEQRIGRLDRIGQKKTINIHIPFITGSPQEALIKWYHDGFNAFEDNAADAFLLYEKFQHSIQDIALNMDFDTLKSLIRETQLYHAKMSEHLQAGRNRLLELNSFDETKAKALQTEIRNIEDEPAFEDLMLRLFQHFDVHHDAHDDLHVIGQDHLTNAEFPFPAFRNERVPITFDRTTALSREELEYVTPDHPMAMGAIDLLLGSEKGNAVLATWPSDSQDILLEAFFIHECVAPAYLHIERFFPPTLLRILVNHSGENLTKKYSFAHLNKNCKNAKNAAVLENPSIKLELFPDLLDACFEQAHTRAKEKQAKNEKSAMDAMNTEIDRLVALQKINANISDEEILSLKREKVALRDSITNARLRLDSIRLIIKG
jgi:ATP-dependent helicase HepA